MYAGDLFQETNTKFELAAISKEITTVYNESVDLYLNFEKSSWKNQVQILKLIFAGYTGSKNPVRNRLRIQFVELDFSKLIFQKSSTDQQGNRLTCLLSVCFR